MLTAILFDLDNTLIFFNEIEFYYRYTNCLSETFHDLIPEDIFKKRLMISTQALLQNKGNQRNIDYFMDHFCKDFEDKRNLIWDQFEKFYETEFDQFQQLMQPIPDLLVLFEHLKQINLKIAIASNPILPKIAQLKRLSWAGLNNFQFDLITHITNTSYCKPHLGYYSEICEKLKIKPEFCLMVGNDPINDMIASQIGMKTYLTTDSLQLNRSSLDVSQTIRKDHKVEEEITIDFEGPLLEIKKIIHHLLSST